MKLLVLSDLHLEFAPFELPSDVRFDVLVLAGDIGCPGHTGVTWAHRAARERGARAVVLVPGNHEYYDQTMHAAAAAMQAAARRASVPTVHLLDRAAVVIDGVRFLGCTLWTDFALPIDTPDGPRTDVAAGMAAARRLMVDYRTISLVDETGAMPRKLTAEDTLHFHRRDRDWLQAALAEPFDGSTVVVTHHGPARGSLAERYARDWVSTAFINELPAAFFDVPRLWVHGHTHTSFDYRQGGCRIVCNPRGYVAPPRPPENPRFDPAKVVETG